MWKWLVAVVVGLGLVIAGPAMAQKSQADLITEVNTNLPSCGNNCINALSLRSVLIDMINSIYAIIIPSNFQVYGPQQLIYWGYVGDGSSHPLSSIVSWQGQNTTGWTLGQWQAVLPSAGSLSDEIDGVVINSLIAKSSGPVAFEFGVTNGQFSGPIKSCINNVSIYGSGYQSSQFTFLNSDGWQHCRGPGDPLVTSRVELKDFAFNSTVKSSGNFGFTGTFQTQNNGKFDNVRFNGFSNCMLFDNAAGLIINYVFCATQVASGDPAAGVGINIRGGVQTGHGGAFINHISDSLMQNYFTGYRFEAIGVGLEDQRVTNSAAGGVNTCVLITGNAATSGYSPFEYSIDNFSCDATTHGVNINRGWHVKINGGDWLVDPPVGSWTGTTSNFFDICRANGVTLRDAFVSNNATAITIASYVRIRAGTDCGIPNPAVPLGVQITNNYFEFVNLTYSDALVAVDATSSGVLIKDNSFLNFFQPVEPPNNAYRWDTTDGNSALFHNTNTGIIVQNGTAVTGITNLVAFNAGHLVVPPGIWQCGGNIQYVAGAGTNYSVVQGAMNTVSAVIPTAPGNGMFLEGQVIAAGSAGIFPTAGFTFDFSAARTAQDIYLVGVASFTGSNASANGILQCVRAR